jgi:hypothetical protein
MNAWTYAAGLETPATRAWSREAQNGISNAAKEVIAPSFVVNEVFVHIGFGAPRCAASSTGALFCSDAVSLIEASYAVAPGLAATASYQRLSAVLSPGMGISSARVAKSTVTKVVMSAAEKFSPATQGDSTSLASMSR